MTPTKRFAIDGDKVWIEVEDRRGHTLRDEPTDEELHAEVIRQYNELARIYALPTLEWLLIKSVIVQRLASMARAGYQGDAQALLADVDKGSTYVSRLIQERDRLQTNLLEINKALELDRENTDNALRVKRILELRRDVAVPQA